MKKLNSLLHDVTVLNFRFIAKLMRRYRRLSMGAVVGVVAVAMGLYLTQPTVFQKQAFFEIQNRAVEDPHSKGGISDIIQSKAQGLKRPELMAIINSYRFRTRLAELIVRDERFGRLDLRGTLGRSESVEAFSCGSEECHIGKVREAAPKLFTVDAENGTGRYILTVLTRSRDTTSVLLESFRTALQEVRHAEALAQVDGLMGQLEALIQTRKAELEATGGFDKVARSNLLDTLVVQQKDELLKLSTKLAQEKEQLNFQRIRLQESTQVASAEIGDTSKLNFERLVKLKKRTDDLRHNIASLSVTAPEQQTATERRILSELQAELEGAERELAQAARGPKRNIAVDGSFIDGQISGQSALEFDVKVVQAKVKGLERDYDKAKAKLDGLYSQKLSLDNELQGLKADIEYLKILEAKHLSLKLKRSTLGAEVFFDDYGPDMLVFKRSSLVQIVLFALLALLFFLVLAVALLYLFDDKIYDAEEVKFVCDDLPVLGQAPRFD